LRKIIFCILLLFLTGCQSENSKISQTSKGPLSSDHTSDETAERAHPLSVWDVLAARHEGPLIIDSPEDPDLFNLYLEGLFHSNPYVQWYASNKIIAFSDHPDKQKAIDALQSLLTSTENNVKSAAQFALHVFEHNFDDPAFIRSPDGKRVAFHLYLEARYNDGEVWIYNSEGNSVYPLKGQWLSVEELTWSPDGRKLAIEYGGRIWGSTDLVDPDTGESLLETSVYDVLQDKQLFKVVKQQRPDPYYRLVEWSPDSTKAMLSYSFTDDDYKVQQGIVIYDLMKAAYTTVEPYPSGEDPYPDIIKPIGFKW
jgi:WD40 repeat protein